MSDNIAKRLECGGLPPLSTSNVKERLPRFTWQRVFYHGNFELEPELDSWLFTLIASFSSRETFVGARCFNTNMRYFTFILAGVILPFCLFAGDSFVKVPKEAKSRDELVKAFGDSIGCGPVERAEFSHFGQQIFVVWYDPFSGRAACYMHAYYYDPSRTEWVLFIDRLFEGASDLSAELSSEKWALVVRDSEGKVVLEQCVTNVPAEKWDEKK